MVNCGNFNLDNNAALNQPLVFKAGPNLVTITTAVGGIAPIVQVLTVATLPAATTALKGTVVAVSDATTPALGTALVGGGAVFCLGLCTGAAWVAV